MSAPNPSIYDEINWLKTAINKDSYFGSVLGRGTVDTSFTPVTSNGIYRMPTPANAKHLVLRSDSAADTFGGTGGQIVELRYVDSEGFLQVENIFMAGTGATAQTQKPALRFQYATVIATGTQYTLESGSHQGTIIIEDTDGLEWGRIDASNFPLGVAQSSMLCIPANKTMYLTYYNVTVDSSKITDVAFFLRPLALTENAPYPATIFLSQQMGLTAGKVVNFPFPVGNFPGPADFGMVGRVSQGSGDVEVAYQYLLV